MLSCLVCNRFTCRQEIRGHCADITVHARVACCYSCCTDPQFHVAPLSALCSSRCSCVVDAIGRAECMFGTIFGLSLCRAMSQLCSHDPQGPPSSQQALIFSGALAPTRVRMSVLFVPNSPGLKGWCQLDRSRGPGRVCGMCKCMGFGCQPGNAAFCRLTGTGGWL